MPTGDLCRVGLFRLAFDLVSRGGSVEAVGIIAGAQVLLWLWEQV